MHILEVGKPFDLFTGRNLTGQDGAIFEAVENGGFALVIYMSSMTFDEVILLRKAPISVRIIKETESFVITMIRFGNSPLIFEINFDPILYKDKRREQLIQSNIINLIGVDSNTNIIKVLRLVNMPKKLFWSLNTAWDQAEQEENFSAKYTRWVDDLDRRYTVLELWKMGKSAGLMGEE